jgi:hypothetical protein
MIHPSELWDIFNKFKLILVLGILTYEMRSQLFVRICTPPKANTYCSNN